MLAFYRIIEHWIDYLIPIAIFILGNDKLLMEKIYVFLKYTQIIKAQK